MISSVGIKKVDCIYLLPETCRLKCLNLTDH